MIKKHSYDIVKLFLDQIGMTVFSLILITSLGLLSDSIWLKFGLSVFTTLFFSVIIYATAWDLGAKDKLSYEAGRGEYFPLKGLVLSVFANIPNFVLAGFAAIALLISKAGSEALFTLGGVLLTVAKFIMAIYLGFVNTLFHFLPEMSVTDNAIANSVAFFVVPVIAIGVTQLGYALGLREKKLFGGAMDAKRNK